MLAVITCPSSTRVAPTAKPYDYHELYLFDVLFGSRLVAFPYFCWQNPEKLKQTSCPYIATSPGWPSKSLAISTCMTSHKLILRRKLNGNYVAYSLSSLVNSFIISSFFIMKTEDSLVV
jgi:hypothetical protein